LKKVESSTLKECGEEKARGALHPKCRSERRNVSSLPSLHLPTSPSRLFLCYYCNEKNNDNTFFFVFEKKKKATTACCHHLLL